MLVICSFYGSLNSFLKIVLHLLSMLFINIITLLYYNLYLKFIKYITNDLSIVSYHCVNPILVT